MESLIMERNILILSELKEIPEIKELIDSKIICSLENSDKFFAPGGMTNIAKFLLEGFDIKKQHKLIDFKKMVMNIF